MSGAEGLHMKPISVVLAQYARASILFTSLLCSPSSAFAICVVDSSGHNGPPDAFTRHLESGCSATDREAYAVKADDLLEALKTGRSLDLSGVMIVGDLSLDQLPLTPVRVSELPSPSIQEAVHIRRLTELRQISGSISIKNSIVRGVIRTGLKEGLLLAKGPVIMSGTTFERAVDFSRTAFLGPVDFSRASLLQQGFFIQALFDQPARFERTAFGLHTRFHRAVFLASSTFLEASFKGLAEFLEVKFEKDADFARTSFKMGTGFSGSHFNGVLDFSDALFEREIYFLFTVFDKDAYFRRATFRGQADFSDAQFRGLYDFSKTFFRVEPVFARTRFSGAPSSMGKGQDFRVVYGLATMVMIGTVIHKNR